jgi:hypothetical protein
MCVEYFNAEASVVYAADLAAEARLVCQPLVCAEVAFRSGLGEKFYAISPVR